MGKVGDQSFTVGLAARAAAAVHSGQGVGGLHCSAVCLSVCLRSHTEKGTTGISLKKKEFKKMEERKRGGWPPLFRCVSVCLRSHTEKGTTGKSLKKEFKKMEERKRGGWPPLFRCVCV